MNVDAVSLLLLVTLTVAVSWRLVHGGVVVGQDTSTQFYPWFEYLGRNLRAGHIPGWNPYSFSGSPFAADPQSGWMYLPAMVFFILLPLSLAARAYILFHLMATGIGIYVLARVLRMTIVGALLAAIAYELTGFLYGNLPCCPNHTGIEAWLPLMILGAELSMLARSRRSMVLGWLVAGFALSQVAAIWLGQGLYYVLLVLASHLAYRAILGPSDSGDSPGQRLVRLVANGAGILLVAFGFAAAGVLPRIEYNSVSSLAGGYTGTDQEGVGGWSLKDVLSLFNLGGPGTWYAGGAILALAVLAPFFARRRYTTPYWAGLSAVAVVLALRRPTPLHWLLYHLLPGFASLHSHEPERIVMVFYIGPALLAGATVSSLPRVSRRMAPVLLLPTAALLLLLLTRLPVSRTGLAAGVVAILLIGVSLVLQNRTRLLGALMVIVAAGDLVRADMSLVTSRLRMTGAHAYRKVNLASYYSPTDAGSFLLYEAGRGTLPLLRIRPEDTGQSGTVPATMGG